MAMKKLYQQAFTDALKKYKQGAERPGHPLTFFERVLRTHSRILYPTIQKLQRSIGADTSTKESIKADFISFFKSGGTRFRAQSFAQYLLDELTQIDTSYNWQEHNKYQLKSFRGTLYRGCNTPPQHAFRYGIQSGETSRRLFDYMKLDTDPYGTSTTKAKYVAKFYVSAPKWRSNGSDLVIPRFSDNQYLYKINYRGNLGIDIPESFRARGYNRMRVMFADEKKEVNIIDTIPPEDIIGVWRYKKGEEQSWTPNPRYVEERSVNQLSLFQASREHFSSLKEETPSSAPTLSLSAIS